MMKTMLSHDHKINTFILFLMIATLLPKSASHALAQEQKQALGELKIEGEHIEKLVLCRKDGRTEQFDDPENTIKLAVGEYRLQDVRLEGGYTSNNSRTSKINWITVTEKEPAVYKVGAPLKQTVKIERQGPILKLNYELTGVGGETYGSMRSAQPTFTVFKGEKKVDTDEFEFG
jgi:hypothetical protein